ncbi:MAG: hypothetical protein P8H89_02000 [Porticoccaceae bacterium]|nr:hypothetical protein [Porticoccaceae bacterium]
MQAPVFDFCVTTPSEAHRLLWAPLTLSANVITSITADEFTVNGFKMSTIPYPLLQSLQSLQSLHSPQQVAIPPLQLYRCVETSHGLDWAKGDITKI